MTKMIEFLLSYLSLLQLLRLFGLFILLPCKLDSIINPDMCFAALLILNKHFIRGYERWNEHRLTLQGPG